ncbi:MAG: lipase maturation factor family protein [Candidatus Dadabacteria bacterium]|nr:lipase maturation factor family protein [Candidatus Dadabacteria bacterium]NIS08067.1 lipase maturation factor family protein [Candidatus Dadabacteria bacterium]NIV42315.1 lipase maturation factor family protein [Candidatus Dadabacteria bacterium]NIX14810.1 lipase maturation factor family protein [Candidatus Dadabacteria bacterium]NIY21351.1 lipase maturation factor family protein [Candidatus Dadabacteria bacterium]
MPTINWINPADTFLYLQLIISIVFSALLIAGITPILCSIVLWISYLSIVNIGQSFMSFQWDILLLEAGFLTILISPFKLLSTPKGNTSPNILLIFLFKLLLFKLMFSSGIGKILSGEQTWRNLTALNFHYFTQPLPNHLAWYSHHLPQWFHKCSVAIMLFIEIIIPFFFFAPRRLRYIAGFLTVGLQIIIMATGNYTFFNLLSIALCLFLFDDTFFKQTGKNSNLIFKCDENQAGRKFTNIKLDSLSLLVLIIVSLTIIQFSRRYLGVRNIPQFVNNAVRYTSPFHIVNNYGLFTVMTTSRNEIIIEGSNDRVNWKAYEFKYKPGKLKGGLHFVAPHQPRLDWQMWFAAFGDYRRNHWFVNLMYRIGEGSPQVLGLLKHNPFPDSPPKYLRAQVYDFKFTNWDERESSGDYWKRTYLGYYMPVLSNR